MNSEKIQGRNELARQIVRALDDGERIVDSIAKGDGKWKAMTVDAKKASADLHAFAEKCREGDDRGK
jgi:hypothetical protein